MLLFRVALATAFAFSALVRAGSAKAEEKNPVFLRPVERVNSQPDPTSLRAGAVLFAFSYGLALSLPIRHGFDEQTRWIAVPVVGPFSRPSELTWALTLDGLLQVGSLAFFGKAFASPRRILGPARAASEPLGRASAAAPALFAF